MLLATSRYALSNRIYDAAVARRSGVNHPSMGGTAHDLPVLERDPTRLQDRSMDQTDPLESASSVTAPRVPTH